MAYIITNTGYEAIYGQTNNKLVLNCMRTFCKKNETKLIQHNIYDSNAITEKLAQAAKVKQKLDADIFERDKRILENAEVKSKI